MSEPEATQASRHQERVVAEFRANLLDRDRYVVAAANAGAATNPDWYHNLVADPAVIVEIGDHARDPDRSHRPARARLDGTLR
jgi:hypothetical protein